MPVNTAYSRGTTVFSDLSLSGGNLLASNISSSASQLVNELWASSISASGVTADTLHGRTASSNISVNAIRATGSFLAPNGTALLPGYRFNSEGSLGFYRSGNSTIVQSYGTFNLHGQAVRLSLATKANATAPIVGEFFLVFQASGISLMYSSGATVYSITSSALSSAA